MVFKKIVKPELKRTVYFFFITYRRAKLSMDFGTQALQLCRNILKQASDFEELQRLVEDLAEKIEINVKVNDLRYQINSILKTSSAWRSRR